MHEEIQLIVKGLLENPYGEKGLHGFLIGQNFKITIYVSQFLTTHPIRGIRLGGMQGLRFGGRKPFGIHHFEGKPKGEGNLVLKKKKKNFKYRFLFHVGDPNQADVSKQYIEWSKEGNTALLYSSLKILVLLSQILS